jgi:hypothetical protein
MPVERQTLSRQMPLPSEIFRASEIA